MKKLFWVLIPMMIAAACSPKLQDGAVTCFRGKLVKRGACGQEVVQLLSKPVNDVAMAAEWTDSLSHIRYEHVFAVGNPCDFPVSIKEGEEFTFSIATTPPSNCVQCDMYTPVPAEKNNIVTSCPE